MLKPNDPNRSSFDIPFSATLVARIICHTARAEEDMELVFLSRWVGGPMCRHTSILGMRYAPPLSTRDLIDR